VPFFFASYGIEYIVARIMAETPDSGLQDLPYPGLRLVVRKANLTTYGVMFVCHIHLARHRVATPSTACRMPTPQR
jgi:hypothetical protein